jgi:hypothetical protein
MSRFPETFCSQCGAGLGPGDEGVSRCADHTSDDEQGEILSLAYQLTNKLRSEYGLKNGNPIYRALRKMAEAAAKPANPDITTYMASLAAENTALRADKAALVDALMRILRSEHEVAISSESELCILANSADESAVVREQAAAVLQARAALAGAKP